MLGKAITLRSVAGPSVTIMDALYSNHVILCDSSEGPSTIIDGFTITGGAEVHGGGLNCSYSSPTIVNCIFTDNSAPGSGSEGGGIRCWGANPSITNCTFQNNSAYRGGGIYCYNSDPEITTCTFVGNVANWTGGGICCEFGSDPIITSCLFSNNTCIDRGGGILNYENSSPTITGCFITSNQRGGIYSWSNSIPVINNSFVCGNVEFQIDGDWINNGDVCIAYSCDDDDSDGIPDKCQNATDDNILQVPSEYLTIQAAINDAVTGDTVLVSPGTYFTFNDSVVNPMGKSIVIKSSHGPEVTIIDGHDLVCGVICNSGETNDTIIEGFTITHGYKYGGGGGIFCGSSPPSSPSIIDCIITECSANIVGGGILITGWVDPLPPTYSPRIIDCVISSNLAQAGGGIACLGGSPEISNCQILDNSADQSNPGQKTGGGVLVGMRSAATFTDCTISQNSSTEFGGGIGINEWGSPSFFNCTIQNNSAVLSGGGIYANSWENINLSNCTLSNNVSPPSFTDTDLDLRCPNFSIDSMCSSSTVTAAGTTSLILKPGTVWSVDGEFTTSVEGNLTFVLEGVLDIPNTEVPLSVSDELLQQGCLAIHTDTGSLAGVEEGDVIALAEVGSLSGNFESVVFPIMPEGLGLQLVENLLYGVVKVNLVSRSSRLKV